MTDLNFLVIGICCIFTTLDLTAQMHDNVWCMGYDNNPDSTSNFGGNNLYFDGQAIPRQEWKNRECEFDLTSSSMCDADGNLLFYTNGCKIYGADDQVIEGGDSLTRMDNYWTQSFLCPYGFTSNQGVLSLPNPYNPAEYFVMYQDVNTFDDGIPKLNELYYSIVDMSANNNKGNVVEKNILIYNELMSYGSFSATRHTNGQEWWVLVNTLNENKIVKFLISENGLQLDDIQEIGLSLDFQTISMSAKFSPDGKKYARFHLLTGLELFDFDRRTGQLSNARHFPFWNSLDGARADGLEFSPDSKKLYISYNKELSQIDLTADDILESRVVIDTMAYDTITGYTIAFYQMQLTPAGEIFINNPNSLRYMHVIHNPNEKGKACNYERKGQPLRTHVILTMPYFPNFRLGPDTTTSTADLDFLPDIRMYPNPTTGVVYIDISQSIHYEVCNANGQLIGSEILDEKRIDLSDEPPGVYFIRLTTDDHRVVTRRIVLIR